jgi:phospholipase/carboxylesterase
MLNILRNMDASVTEKIYGGMGHTINPDEINQGNSLVFGAKTVNH